MGITTDRNSECLGQYFTPRSVVKLVARKGVEKVIDPCCGTGGFLITEMRNAVRDNQSLTAVERVRRLEQIETS